jgi:hypothetical protein
MCRQVGLRSTLLHPHPACLSCCLALNLCHPASFHLCIPSTLSIQPSSSIPVPPPPPPPSPDDESEVSFDSLSSDTHGAASALALHSLRVDASLQAPLSPYNDSVGLLSPPVSRKDQSALARSFIGTAGGSSGGGLGAGGASSAVSGVGFGAPRRRSRAGSLSMSLSVPRPMSMPPGKLRMAFGPADVFASPRPRHRGTGLGTARDLDPSSALLQRKGSRRVRLLLARAFM